MTQQSSLFPEISEEMRVAAEAQIIEKQKEVDYDIREYPVEVIRDKFVEEISPGKTELFIPDYQRELVWKHAQKSKFIESLFLKLPIPYLFVADVGDESDDSDGRLEIVDGSQRIRTLVEFMSNAWPLRELKVLPALNSFYYRDLPQGRRLRFNRITLRMIELTEASDEEARRMIFDRLNSGGTRLESMEQRIGTDVGPFLDLIKELSEDKDFRRLCPISDARSNRREYQELTLRFFAYRDAYLTFNKRVDTFLSDYLKRQNTALAGDPSIADDNRKMFREMLAFVATYFPQGFRKSSNNKSVPRIRFEAISVGTSLALAVNSNLQPPPVSSWIESPEFLRLTRSDASNSRPRVIDRITYVRDHLLNQAWTPQTDEPFTNETDE